MQEAATIELSHEVDVAEESVLELEDLLVVGARQERLHLFSEELIEAGAAVVEQRLAELTGLDGLHCDLLLSVEVYLKLDDLLAEGPVERAVFLLVLSLPEDRLHDDAHVLLT